MDHLRYAPICDQIQFSPFPLNRSEADVAVLKYLSRLQVEIQNLTVCPDSIVVLQEHVRQLKQTVATQ